MLPELGVIFRLINYAPWFLCTFLKINNSSEIQVAFKNVRADVPKKGAKEKSKKLARWRQQITHTPRVPSANNPLTFMERLFTWEVLNHVATLINFP